MTAEPDTQNVVCGDNARTEIRCGIVVFSDSMGPADVAAHVGVEPTEQSVKGEPLPGRRSRSVVVARHRWAWRPGSSVDRSLDAQLDAIWAALGSRADSFRSLPADAEVVMDIWIEHYGDELQLGWRLDRRHVSAAAAFEAAIGVDEYDYTTDTQGPTLK